MTVESMLQFIYSHRTETGFAMPYNKMYLAVRSFLDSHRKPLSDYSTRQVETATFTMTLFSVLHSTAFHQRGPEIVGLFLAYLAKIANESSLANVPSNEGMTERENLLMYFDHITYRIMTPPSFRGIVPTTYDFSMEDGISFTPITNRDTTYFNALSVSLYAFVHSLREYEAEPRPFVSHFFDRNAELEKISDSTIYMNFCETPTWMDMVIEY
jgi:hypothetical protein